jgi:hypothetical protein
MNIGEALSDPRNTLMGTFVPAQVSGPEASTIVAAILSRGQ